MALCRATKEGKNFLPHQARWRHDQRHQSHLPRDLHHHVPRKRRELSKARDMAGHVSMRTTQLYDRRSRAVKIDDVVLINLRAKPKE
jgi:hypothetical protein